MSELLMFLWGFSSLRTSNDLLTQSFAQMPLSSSAFLLSPFPDRAHSWNCVYLFSVCLTHQKVSCVEEWDFIQYYILCSWNMDCRVRANKYMISNRLEFWTVVCVRTVRSNWAQLPCNCHWVRDALEPVIIIRIPMDLTLKEILFISQIWKV
jgi:hypothetical protein